MSGATVIPNTASESVTVNSAMQKKIHFLTSVVAVWNRFTSWGFNLRLGEGLPDIYEDDWFCAPEFGTECLKEQWTFQCRVAMGLPLYVYEFYHI